MLLDRIEKAGLKLKLGKCHLLGKKVYFLWHIISGHRIRPSPENATKVLQFAAPETGTHARAVVGMESYYRRHIENYSGMMKLIDLTKKGKKFVWSEQYYEALKMLKEALISQPIMAYSLDTASTFSTATSDYAIGGVLSQIQGVEETVMSYGSKILNKAERNYCVTDKELLALRYFIEYYRQYLLDGKLQ